MQEKPEKISLKSLDIGLKNLDAKLDMRIDAMEAYQRRMGVLLEDMNGRLSLLLEGYTGHDTRIVGLEDRIEKVEGRVDMLS